jgi:hypothetical protein
MLQGIKRWLSNPLGAAPAVPGVWADIAGWARQGGHGFRSVQDEGFVVDGKAGDVAWRMEWGPSQRPYIDGNELRLRADLPLVRDLQLALMNRRLQESMERAVFEQYVEGVQTRIDQQTPPEMRWLVMFPRLSGDELGVLRANFVAVASSTPWMASWLQGPLGRALMAAPLDTATPVALMIGRSRLMLRTAMADPELHSLRSWLALFETAIGEAGRVSGQAAPPVLDAIVPGSDLPSAWAASALPEGEGRA